MLCADYLYLARLRYEEGEVDYLNVLDAELALVQAQAENYTAVVQFYGALGGGWVYDADAEAISNCNRKTYKSP